MILNFKIWFLFHTLKLVFNQITILTTKWSLIVMPTSLVIDDKIMRLILKGIFLVWLKLWFFNRKYINRWKDLNSKLKLE
jgi:hypothetical protein